MRIARILSTSALVLAIALVGLTACALEPNAADTAEQRTTQAASPSPTPVRPTAEELRHEEAVERVAAASTRENVASIVMSTASGVDPAAIQAFVGTQGMGGFILMGPNVPESPEELAALTSVIAGDPEFPVLVAIDQEGGAVSRLPWDELPSALTLKSEERGATQEAFAARAALLAQAGVSVNFGIVADVTAEPGSFMFDRVLGTTPEGSADRVTAAVIGEQGLALSTLKHFPGHGSAPGNSHEMIPQSQLSRDMWNVGEAVPFAAGIDAGAELLMFGHLRYPSIDPKPASVSPEWHRIAREDFGFAGVIVTDDLAMLLDSGEPEYLDPTQNAILALQAGNDLLLHLDGASVPEMIEGVTAAVESGAVPRTRLDDAATRVAELRLLVAARHSP